VPSWLEWPEDLAPIIRAFLAREVLADHSLLWFGDGRITAGHLAVLRERAAAGPLSLTLFDGANGAGWSWSQRDEAMPRRILAHPAAPSVPWWPPATRTLPLPRRASGYPLGRAWPGVAEVRIRYGGGRYYNIESRRFMRIRLARRQPRMHYSGGALVLDLPAAREAVVPQRPSPWPEGRQLR